MVDDIVKLVHEFGPHMTIALAGFAWAFWERKENQRLTGHVIELAKAQIEIALKNEAALIDLKREIK